MYKILIIEDNIKVRTELKNYLNSSYEVFIIDDFTQTFQLYEKIKPDLILLDINLPIFDGYRICQEIRKKDSTPIIIITSQNEDSAELLSMKLGADDYIQKPYNIQILEMRIEAVLRRVYQHNTILKVNNVLLDISKNLITFNNKTIDLSNTESKIIYYLFKNKNKIVEKNTLMKFLWNQNLFIDENVLSVNISRLRKKLESIQLFHFIHTKRGIGYGIYEDLS